MQPDGYSRLTNTQRIARQQQAIEHAEDVARGPARTQKI
jgi:hypothetical protein